MKPCRRHKFAPRKKKFKSFFDKTLTMVRCPNNLLLKISHVHHSHLTRSDDISIFLVSIDGFLIFLRKKKKQGLMYFSYRTLNVCKDKVMKDVLLIT